MEEEILFKKRNADGVEVIKVPMMIMSSQSHQPRSWELSSRRKWPQEDAAIMPMVLFVIMNADVGFESAQDTSHS